MMIEDLEVFMNTSKCLINLTFDKMRKICFDFNIDSATAETPGTEEKFEEMSNSIERIKMSIDMAADAEVTKEVALITNGLRKRNLIAIGILLVIVTIKENNKMYIAKVAPTKVVTKDLPNPKDQQ